MPGIGIITNPYSKLNKRNPRRKHLLGYIVGEHGNLTITNSLEDLSRAAEKFKSSRVEVLAISGGDGTISRTLTAFHQVYGNEPLPKIAILGGGTINVLKSNLGLKGTPEQILYRLTQAFGTNDQLESKRLHAIDVDGNLGFLFGNGISSSFLEKYYEHKSGPIGAAWWVLRVWFSSLFQGKLFRDIIQDWDFSLLRADGSSHRQRGVAVFCSTVRNMPLSIPLFTKLGDNEDSFQTICFGIRAKAILWQLPLSLLLPKKLNRLQTSFMTNKLEVTSSTKQNYTLDGELFLADGKTVSVGLGPELDFVTI